MAVLVAALAGFVQRDPACLQQRLVGHAMGAPQQRLNTQQQFFGMERFGQVIVGPGFESFDALGP